MSTDTELVERWRRGERSACAQLFERYYDGLARFFRSKVPEAADDLVQRTFLRCFEGLARIADATAFRSYLFGIACNVLREHYRSVHRDGARLEFTSVSAQELAPSASAVVGWQQEQRLLLEALRRIPLGDQILLELCYWEQLPGREIAAVVGAPLGTVKAHLRTGSRARRADRARARLAAPAGRAVWSESWTVGTSVAGYVSLSGMNAPWSNPDRVALGLRSRTPHPLSHTRRPFPTRSCLTLGSRIRVSRRLTMRRKRHPARSRKG